MTRRNDLPEELTARPFRVEEARALGLSRKRLQASDLASPFWGVRREAAPDLDYAARCSDLIAALDRPAILSGVSAARLHGLPLPRRCDDVGFEVAVRPPARAVRRPGVTGRRLAIADIDVMTHGSLVLTTPARTWCDLATRLTFHELVAVGDEVTRRAGDAAGESLRAVLSRLVSPRHSTKLRLALDFVDPRAESPKESELRMILHEAGLPTPEVNPSIYDGTRFVARVDLLFRDERVVVEYQGDQHRTDRTQWRRDITRRAELESLGYTVIEVTQADLIRPSALITRIRRVLAS
ncbi:DUF559 domain-containing protein [Agromyces atrinae]|uniref:DUF559 domain-containing protein n=1 Tax=Agromyces atrinae TaxID=592376 RepID=A0A4Q2MCE4_9MICO|nr:DUF559 domain-containing protein [Agromyces atrinae]NYD67632.1 hypothetical protein [Agromyces atrinae]RXZ88163.1 DUF559 domain-containing protein [Agromyces atrinae]